MKVFDLGVAINIDEEKISEVFKKYENEEVNDIIILLLELELMKTILNNTQINLIKKKEDNNE